MFQENSVHVSYSGHIKHDVREQHARPLSGPCRETVKDILRKCEKSLNVYLHELNKLPADELVAGNFGNIGLNARKNNQIGVKAHH